LKQKTLLGDRSEDAAPASLARNGSMVEFGVESQERQLEAVLPARLAVARPCVAPSASQNWFDVTLERNAVGRVCVRGHTPERVICGDKRQQAEGYRTHSNGPFANQSTHNSASMIVDQALTSNNYLTGADAELEWKPTYVPDLSMLRMLNAMESF
jgi:hypothetical protein